MMRIVTDKEEQEMLTARAYEVRCNTDPIATWTDGETYTVVGSRRTDKIQAHDIIGEGWSAQDVSNYFEELGNGEDE